MVFDFSAKIIFMSVQFPYRAIIFGEEYIVTGWRRQKIVTDKGCFHVGQLFSDSPIQTARILEIALFQISKTGEWLLNGKSLEFLKSLPTGPRLDAIGQDENLRVHKGKIQAVVWIQTERTENLTQTLDLICECWKMDSLPAEKKGLFAKLNRIQNLFDDYRRFKEWGKLVWLTEFRPDSRKPSPTGEQVKLARVNADLIAIQALLKKAQAAAGDTLQEALSKWMRFDPPRMSADTKARIEKAVKLYLTDPEKRSLARIAADFKVSRKTVSEWFKKFTTETGFKVVTFQRHSAIRRQSEIAMATDENDTIEDNF